MTLSRIRRSWQVTGEEGMTGEEGYLSLAPFPAPRGCSVNAHCVRTELNREAQTLFLRGEESPQ